MKIQVTAEDIEAGQPLCADECPIARAITRLMNDERDVLVWKRCVTVDGESFDLPGAEICFRQDFDCGKPVEPIEFDLPIERLNARHPARL